jgi:hypothetical protein
MIRRFVVLKIIVKVSSPVYPQLRMTSLRREDATNDSVISTLRDSPFWLKPNIILHQLPRALSPWQLINMVGALAKFTTNSIVESFGNAIITTNDSVISTFLAEGFISLDDSRFIAFAIP